MESSIIEIIIGLVFIVIGILNIKGNISMLHSYHIDKISEEDKPIFAKLVGIGVIVVGISIAINGGMLILNENTSNEMYSKIGNILLFAVNAELFTRFVGSACMLPS